MSILRPLTWHLGVCCLYFLLTIPFNAKSQVLDNPCNSSSAQKAYLKARQMRSTSPWQKTFDQYNKALEKCPEWPLLYPEIALFLQKKGEKKKAIEVLNQGGEDLWNLKPDWLFRTGNLEFESEMFEDAKIHLSEYLDSGHDNDLFRRAAKEKLAHATFAIEAMANPEKVDLVPLPTTINSNYPEYLPVLTADEQLMIFTRREGGREEIFFSRKDANGNWQLAEPMDLGTRAYRKGGFHISPDGKLIVFAMADHPACVGGFDLFYLRNNGTKWEGPYNLGTNVNTPEWESQPCIGPDSRTIYFASGRKGGEGKKDLWYTKMTNPGEWTDPINLGPTINTRYDESSPYLHRDGETFYFRSKGHPGLGDFDLFKSTLTLDSGFIKPLNLGYPINGSGNEGGLFVSMNGKDAFYATSSTEGEATVVKDIYTFVLPQKLRAKPATYILATVVDKQTGLPIRSKVVLSDFNREKVVFNATTDATGTFLSCIPKGTDYALQASAKGYLLKSERFELSGEYTSDKPFEIVIELEAVPVSREADTLMSPIILKNVLFKFGTAELVGGSYSELDALADLLKSNSSASIIIQGHTDSVGEDDKNQKLSLDRAKSVHDYLIQVGIDTPRLSFEGYGESRPIATNDTEEGRKQNRRVEFIYLP